MLEDGRRFQTLYVLDTVTRVRLGIEVDTSERDQQVASARAVDLLAWHTQHIPLDNSSEFTGQALGAWVYQHRVPLDFIDSGKPMQTNYLESCNTRCWTARCAGAYLHMMRFITK